MAEMMHLIYFGLVVFLSSSQLCFIGIECKPAFTKTPSSNGKVYVDEGTNRFALSWDFNTDGETVNWVDLMYKKSGAPDVLIARKVGNQLQVPKTSNYYGRVTAGTGKATFVLWYIAKSDERTFECKVYFSSVTNPWIMNAFNLIVVVKPKITLSTSQAVILTEGDTKTLLCVASGNPAPSYTWYKDNGQVQQDADKSNYTITTANRNHAGTYRCQAVVTAPGLGPYRTDYSVDVTVRYKPQHKVNSLERNETVYLGRDAMFYCRAQAFPIDIQYSWFKEDFQISNSRDYTIDNLGFGESRLTVKQVKKRSAGRYSCYGRNDVGNGKRKTVYLTVQYAPLQITLTPDPAVVRLNQTITLTCQADALPIPRYSWKFNGHTLTKAVQSTLKLTNADVKDAGNYTCVAENFFGSKETTRMVNVEYPPTVQTFTTGTPQNTVVKETTVTLTCSANGYPAPSYVIKRRNETMNSTAGRFVIPNIQLREEDHIYSCEPNNAIGRGATKQLKITVQVPPSFSASLPLPKQTKKEDERVHYLCEAAGKPAPNITWMFKGKNLTDKPPFDISTSFHSPSPFNKLWTTQSFLTINKLTWKQGGIFYCLAFNAAGKQIQSTELEVEYRPVVQSLADHPRNLTVEEGANATFVCRTKGNPPTEAHKWQFNGFNISGSRCSGCPTSTFTKLKVKKSDAGWYSCTGSNIMGEGPPAGAYLSVKYHPTITFLPNVYTVNETRNVSMLCRADSVPDPTITWRKKGSSEVLTYGEQLHIVNANSSDDGAYTCTASNYLGQDTKQVTLNVQTHPMIETSSSTVTEIPANEGEEVVLTCIFSGKPRPSPSWKRQINGTDLKVSNNSYVKNITDKNGTCVMKVIVSKIGEHFYCVAANLLGSDNLRYTIRKRGVPDPPSDIKLVAFKVADAKTVSVNVSWTPGYSGGYEQEFTIYYRVKGTGSDYAEQYVGHLDNNMYTIQGLYPETEYEFIVQASNQAGNGQASALANVATPESSIPPDRGTVNATRIPDDVTVILVEWTIEDQVVTTLSLEIQQGGESQWEPVTGASNMSRSIKQCKVTDLKADERYRFRMDMRRPGEQSPVYVFSDLVPAGHADAIPEKRESTALLKNWMMAVIAGLSGAILLTALILCLCYYRRRCKTVDKVDNAKKNPTSSYVVGGPDVAPAMGGTSYGRESIEDDPFVVAASMQALNSVDGKKKKLDASINYGYLHEDSGQQQPEMLLKPGSHQVQNGHVVKRTGNLDANSAYPAKGPQRDLKSFGTSVELVRTLNRHANAIENPVYSAVDKQEFVSGPKASTLPLSSKQQNGVIKGPLDPTVPYATVHKKKKAKNPRHEPHKPASEPPPRYTPEDKPPEEPNLGDLDLDDPSSLPPSERPPDQPTPIPMLPNKQSSNNYHKDPRNGSPGPPGFFYIPVNRKARSHTYGAKMAQQPPPPGRPRKRYATIDGQLVRLNSQDSEDFRRPESTQKTLGPNPEEPTDYESDIRGVPNMNYVSYLV